MDTAPALASFIYGEVSEKKIELYSSTELFAFPLSYPIEVRLVRGSFRQLSASSFTTPIQGSLPVESRHFNNWLNFQGPELSKFSSTDFALCTASTLR